MYRCHLALFIPAVEIVSGTENVNSLATALIAVSKIALCLWASASTHETMVS